MVLPYLDNAHAKKECISINKMTITVDGMLQIQLHLTSAFG